MPAEFGVATATFLIVASMVGTGVLTSSGLTVYFVGSNQLMLGLWVLGGVTAACGALTLCELTAMIPRSGGDYVYLHEAYGPVIAFLYGWVSFLIGFAAPAAAAALSAALYLTAPLGLEGTHGLLARRILATVLILAFSVIHTLGRKQSAHVQGSITALKLLILVVFVVAGLVAGRSNFGHMADPQPITSDRFVSMMSSLVYISYAYIGWNIASYLAAEFVDPQRQLPKAIMLGTLGVVVLYLALNVVYALGLSAADVKAIVESPQNTIGPDAVAPIARLAAERLFSPRVSRAFTLTFGFLLLSSLSAYVLAGPRVIYAMAVAGQFPAVAGRLTEKSRTPAIATALQCVPTLVFVWVSSLAGLMAYASVGLAIFSILAVGAVYVLRWTRPDLSRPFRTPGYPLTPAVYLVVTAALVVASFQRQGESARYAVLSILAGIPFYYAWRWFRGPASGMTDG